jgi:hypothetical protein
MALWWSRSPDYQYFLQLLKGRATDTPRRPARRRRSYRPLIDCVLEDRTLLTVPTTLSLATSVPVAIFGQAITLTAIAAAGDGASPLGAALTGTVKFYDGTSLLGQAGLNGGSGNDQGILQVSSLSVGSHSLSAAYLGDANFDARQSGDLAETVSLVQTTTTLTADSNNGVYGQLVNFTAAVGAMCPGTGRPTGTVTFYDGSSYLGSAVLEHSGLATLYYAVVPQGMPHSITANYGAYGNFAGSTSAPPGLTIRLYRN